MHREGRMHEKRKNLIEVRKLAATAQPSHPAPATVHFAMTLVLSEKQKEMGGPIQQKTLSSRVQWSSVLPKFLKSRKTLSTFKSIQQYMWRHWHISKAAVDFDPSNNCVIWNIVCSTGHLCSLTVTVCTLYTVPSACLGLSHSSSLETSAGSSSTLPPDIWFGGCCDHNINHSLTFCLLTLGRRLAMPCLRGNPGLLRPPGLNCSARSWLEMSTLRSKTENGN